MIVDRLHPIIRRYLAPAGDDGSITDRGDDWTPTEDDPKDLQKAQEAAKKPADDPDEGDDTAKGEKTPKKAAKASAEAEEDDPDGEEDAEGEEKDEKKPTKKDSRMPISRHKEILERERAQRAELEKKLQAYEGGDRVAATNEKIKATEQKIDELDKQYAKHVVDGEHEKAAEIRKQMRALESEIVEQKSDLKAQAATARAVEKVRYDTAVERLEAAYPVLNPESDEFDEDTSQDVIDLSVTYQRRGMTPAEAIQKAAKKLLGTETKKQASATSVKPRVDEEDVEAEKKKLAKEEERKRAQVQKNLDANKKQPPDTSKVGMDHDKAGGGISAKDVMRMSQEDFNKLTEEQLARMRGDALA